MAIIMGKAFTACVVALVLTFYLRNLDSVVTGMIALALFIYVLFIVTIEINRYQKDKLAIDYLRNVPWLDESKGDCYVKATGKLINPDTLTTPQSGKRCNFFAFTVQGEWEHKRKKPQKGMETLRKTLHTVTSDQDMEIQCSNFTVSCNVAAFLKQGVCLLKKDQKTQRSSPVPLPPGKSHPYRRFIITEKHCNHADEVTVFGRLVNNQGRWRLAAPHREQQPAIFAIGKPKTVYNFFQHKVDDRYRLFLWKAAGIVTFSVALLGWNVMLQL